MLQSVCVVCKGIPEIVSNGTSVSTKDDDIAHFTCTSRGEPRPLLRWERNGATVKDSDEGVAILSKSNASLEESHLFIAVTGSGRRGNYICVATNEEGVAKQSFTIVSYSRKLSSTDIAAIGISIGLALFFVLAIAFLMRRGAKKIKQSDKRQRARTISQSSTQAEDQEALMANSTPDKNRECRNGIRKASLSCTTSV